MNITNPYFNRAHQQEEAIKLEESYIIKIVNKAENKNKPIEIKYLSSSDPFVYTTHIIDECEIYEKDSKKYIRTSSDTFYLLKNIKSIQIYDNSSYNDSDVINTSGTFSFPKEYIEVIDIIENTNINIFVTGGAGTGKSTLLKHIVEHTKKKCVVLAPTGIAAINAGGQTIHSFFNFDISLFEKKTIKVNNKKELYQSLEMIIIDEVSMVRVDIMDSIDWALKQNRNNNKPFGGVQMIFVGDVFQLPPVLTPQDNEYIFTNYKSHYFFDAPVLQETEYQFIELTKIFRQDVSEYEFIETLNRIRIDKTTDDDIRLLNSRINYNPTNQAIYLTTIRETANDTNLKKLNSLSSPQKVYTGSIFNVFEGGEGNKINEDKLPAPYKLTLKTDAQVMLLRNDKLGRWVNGTIGTIKELEDTSISILVNGETYNVERETWEQYEYKYNSSQKKIEKQVVGKYVQFPLQLAYAITIHKSQGITFDKVIIDIGNGAFTHGQIYVALSRCRTLNGINLTKRVDGTDIIVDPRVLDYYRFKINPNYQLSSSELLKVEQEKMFSIRLYKALDIMSEQYDYQAPVLKKMVAQNGVRNTIRKLVNSPAPNKGLLTLKDKGALHLSMEALVLEEKWKNLFTETDKHNARQRLEQLEFDWRSIK